MATGIVTPHIRQRAEQLAELAARWPRGRSKVDGRAFYIIPSSRKPETVAHYASHLGCTCPGFVRRGVCAHQQACLLLVQRAEAPRIAAAQRVPCREEGCPEEAFGKSGRCRPHLRAHADRLGI